MNLSDKEKKELEQLEQWDSSQKQQAQPELDSKEQEELKQLENWSELPEQEQTSIEDQKSRISKKYGVDKEKLDSYQLAMGFVDPKAQEKKYGEGKGLEATGRAAAGALGATFGEGFFLGLPAQIYKWAHDENTEKAFDEFRQEVDKRKSFIDKASEFVLAPKGVRGASLLGKGGKVLQSGKVSSKLPHVGLATAEAGLTGLAESDEGDEVKDTAISGITGLAAQGLISGAGKLIPKFTGKLGEIAKMKAEKQAYLASGVTKRDLQNLVKTGDVDASMRRGGRALLDKKIIKPLSTVDDIAERSKELLKQTGEDISEGVVKLDKSSEGVSDYLSGSRGRNMSSEMVESINQKGSIQPKEILDRVKEIGEKYSGLTEYRSGINKMYQNTNKLLKTKKQADGTISLSDLNAFRKEIDTVTNFDKLKSDPKTKVYKDFRKGLSDLFDRKADQINKKAKVFNDLKFGKEWRTQRPYPESDIPGAKWKQDRILEPFENLKKDKELYSVLKPIKDAAEKKALAGEVAPMLSLKDLFVLIGIGGASGDPTMGLGSLAVSKFAMPRARSIGATGLEKVGKWLTKFSKIDGVYEGIQGIRPSRIAAEMVREMIGKDPKEYTPQDKQIEMRVQKKLKESPETNIFHYLRKIIPGYKTIKAREEFTRG